jgi:hypothetical protein
MTIDKQTHLGILIGSINKALREAKRKGRYSVRDLYYLNCIKKTISFSCNISMTEEDQKEIISFYFKVLSYSDKFCTHEFNSEYYKPDGSNSNLFVQTSDNTINSSPKVNDFSIGID